MSELVDTLSSLRWFYLCLIYIPNVIQSKDARFIATCKLSYVINTFWKMAHPIHSPSSSCFWLKCPCSSHLSPSLYSDTWMRRSEIRSATCGSWRSTRRQRPTNISPGRSRRSRRASGTGEVRSGYKKGWRLAYQLLITTKFWRHVHTDNFTDMNWNLQRSSYSGECVTLLFGPFSFLKVLWLNKKQDCKF